jgi:membrane-associated phospholipid phosphatase
LNKFIITSFILFALVILIAILVSPKIRFNVTNNINTVNNYRNSPILKADFIAFLDINNSHSKYLNQLMVLLTEYGREVFWPITIVLLFVAGGWTGKKTAVIIIMSMLILMPVGIIVKDVVARPRPIIPKTDFLLSADSEYAFPSGHAMIVSAGAAVSLALFRNTFKKLAISLALAIEAALVCLSRIYVGGHYPLDVLAGIFLGVGVSFIFVGEVKYIESGIMIPIKKVLKK